MRALNRIEGTHNFTQSDLYEQYIILISNSIILELLSKTWLSAKVDETARLFHIRLKILIELFILIMIYYYIFHGVKFYYVLFKIYLINNFNYNLWILLKLKCSILFPGFLGSWMNLYSVRL